MDNSNWQTQRSTIRERNGYAFNKSLFCDVEFSVVDSNGVKVTIPANKYILAISSPVFEAMFYGPLAESQPTIDLPDCTEESLREMFRYVYSDEVNLTGSNVIEVLYLAEKYMMPFLVEKCKNYLRSKVKPYDVLSVLPEVQKIGDEKIQKHLWSIVDRETLQTVSSRPFVNVSQEMVCQILVRDTLNIKESDIFRSVERWVLERIKEQGLENNGKTKRSLLGEEIIRLIRFPLMTQKEFAEVVLPCEILKKQELTELFQIFNKVAPSTNMFIGKKRSGDCLLIPSVRFRKISPFPIFEYGGNITDAIDFTVTKTVYLIGVQMFGNRGSTYNVGLNICKNDEIVSQSLSPIHIASEKIKDDKYSYGFTVSLDQPVKLDPSAVYTVEARVRGPPSCFGESGKHTMQVGNLTVTYKNSSSSSSKTTREQGQFPTLVFRNV